MEVEVIYFTVMSAQPNPRHIYQLVVGSHQLTLVRVLSVGVVMVKVEPLVAVVVELQEHLVL